MFRLSTVLSRRPTFLETTIATVTVAAVAAMALPIINDHVTRAGMMAADRCGDLQVADTGQRQLMNAQQGQNMQGCFRGS